MIAVKIAMSVHFTISWPGSMTSSVVLVKPEALLYNARPMRSQFRWIDDRYPRAGAATKAPRP